jgi:sulfonate transport system substrate-binding protein
MLTRRKLGASLAAAGLLAKPLIARANTAAPAKIRIGVALTGLGGRPYSLGSAISVVHVQGLLEKEFAADGTAIEWNFYAGAGPAVNEALANGALDFAWQGDLPEIVARSRGLQTTQLFVAGNRSPVFVVVAKDSKIANLIDLKGKTVANFQGTNLELSVNRILASVGLGEHDLQIVNLDQNTAGQAVAEHQIDAAFVQLGIPARAQKYLKVIYATGTTHPELTPQASFIVANTFASTAPDAVDRVVRVAVGAAHWSSLPGNQDALYQIYAKTGYPLPFIEQVFKPIDPLVATSPLWDAFQRAQLTRSASDAYKYGLIRTPVQVEGWIDTGPLSRALTALKLENYWPQFAADGTTKAD